MLNKYPHDVVLVCAKLGSKILDARRSRQIKQQELADRANMSRTTLVAIEKGSPDVSLGNYISALWAMNLQADFDKLIDVDEEAVSLMKDKLPARVRS